MAILCQTRELVVEEPKGCTDLNPCPIPVPSVIMSAADEKLGNPMTVGLDSELSSIFAVGGSR